MPQYLPAGGGLPPRQVVKNVPGSVVYTTAQGGGEVQLHAALPDIARGRGWPQKVYMCQGALGMPRQKGVSKEGKHCRPVGHKILLASIISPGVGRSRQPTALAHGLQRDPSVPVCSVQFSAK